MEGLPTIRLMPSIELPPVLVQSVLSFCDFNDHLTVADLSPALCSHVEAYWGERRERMRQEHRPDASWDARLAVHAGRNLADQDPPPTFSNRDLFKAAQETHLYSFGGVHVLQYGCGHIACHAERNIMITQSARSLHVWDMNTRQCIPAITRDSFAYGPEACFAGDYIVACVYVTDWNHAREVASAVALWRMDGTLLHSTLRFPGYSAEAVATCMDQIYIIEKSLTGESTYFISAVEAPSGERVQRVQHVSTCNNFEMSIVGDWLLVLDCPSWADPGAESGIGVYGKSDLVQVGHVPGKFYHLKGYNDGTTSYFAVWETKLDTSRPLAIKDVDANGAITTRHVIAQPPNMMLGAVQDLCLSTSHAYVVAQSWDDEAPSIMLVVDVTSGGAIVRSLDMYHRVDPFRPIAMATDGRQVFCGSQVGGEDLVRSMHTIKAYPAYDSSS